MYNKGLIFLTGGSGMVGRNIIKTFNGSGWEINAPDRSTLDLSDRLATLKYIKILKPDIIIHAAGMVGGIEANINNQALFLMSNLLLGQNVISAAKEINIKYMLNISSSCIYPKDISLSISENMLLNGHLEPTNEGYAIAKILILKLCEFLSIEHSSLNYKTIVPCNLYGWYDNFNPMTSHMLPSAINKIHKAMLGNKDNVIIWGDGKAKREYMYAGDLANFILFSMDNFDKIPNLLNVGTGEDHTINEYYNIVADVLGYKGKFTNDTTKPEGMKRKLLSIDKQLSLGWLPKTDLMEGVELTYDFYKKRINRCL
tara:strand:- start:1695 stop:2636 length:942 start_codon:yes stop_codon:yes gene_type:complete